MTDTLTTRAQDYDRGRAQGLRDAAAGVRRMARFRIGATRGLLLGIADGMEGDARRYEAQAKDTSP